MLRTLVATVGLLWRAERLPPADSLDAARLSAAPVVDGRVRDGEHGAPALRIPTAAGGGRV